MLLFTAFVCLVLGLGVPTTANYILVATLMAPVIVELGAQSGLVIPLIAVHLFVFYYGIMGDITPPVGLASFAGAAIAGEDAIKVGLQGSVYALRTVILPFIWIFNPQLLLIDVHGWWELTVVVVASTVACLVFAAVDDELVPHEEPLVGDGAAAARGVHALPARTPSWTGMYEPWEDRPAKEIYEVAKDTARRTIRSCSIIEGTNVEGEDVRKTVSVQLAKPGEGRARLVGCRRRPSRCWATRCASAR